MRNRILEIVVYLMDHIQEHRGQIIDIEDLSANLRGLGYTENEISSAYSWLVDRFEASGDNFFSSFPEEHCSTRILTDYERYMFTPDAYGFLLKGKGLWGTISAFGVVSADLDRMVGIDFTEQFETPGLGARITEQEFKYFFRELDLTGFLSESDQPAVVMVGRKERSNVEESTNSIQAITGATQTCNGVLSMLNTDLRFYLRLLQENKEVLASFNRI